MLSSFWSDFTQWAKEPYSSSMTIGGWFLIVGVILISLVVWSTILRKVVD